MSKMLLLARSRSSSRWLFKSKEGPPQAGHWWSALEVARVARARHRKVGSNEDIIARRVAPQATQRRQSCKPGAQRLKAMVSDTPWLPGVLEAVCSVGMTSCGKGQNSQTSDLRDLTSYRWNLAETAGTL